MAIIANVTSPLGITSGQVIPRSIIFTVPPTAYAFLTEGENAVPFPAYKLQSPYVVQGAVSVEGKYLEPNVGQIWPR